MALQDSTSLLIDIDKQLKEASDIVNELKEQKQELQEIVLSELKDTGLDRVSVNGKTFSISTSIKPSVKDWNLFENCIYKTKSLFLLQRRASSAAYVDLLKTAESIPGVESFHKSTLNMVKS